MIFRFKSVGVSLPRSVVHIFACDFSKFCLLVRCWHLTEVNYDNYKKVCSVIIFFMTMHFCLQDVCRNSISIAVAL